MTAWAFTASVSVLGPWAFVLRPSFVLCPSFVLRQSSVPRSWSSVVLRPNSSRQGPRTTTAQGRPRAKNGPRTKDQAPRTSSLPSIVSKRLVRLGHSMRVFPLLDGAAAQVRCVEQLVGELLLHRLTIAARGGVTDDPADAQRQAAVRVHFDRHLIVGAPDTARLHLEARLDIVDRLLENLQRIVAGFFLDDVEALVQDAFGRAPLAVAHHTVDELADERTLIERVGHDVALGNFSSAWHKCSYALGRFAPYLERPCLRPCTPTASSVPRTTW